MEAWRRRRTSESFPFPPARCPCLNICTHCVTNLPSVWWILLFLLKPHTSLAVGPEGPAAVFTAPVFTACHVAASAADGDAGRSWSWACLWEVVRAPQQKRAEVGGGLSSMGQLRAPMNCQELPETSGLGKPSSDCKTPSASLALIHRFFQMGKMVPSCQVFFSPNRNAVFLIQARYRMGSFARLQTVDLA